MVSICERCKRSFNTPKGLNIHKASCKIFISRIINLENDVMNLDVTTQNENIIETNTILNFDEIVVEHDLSNKTLDPTQPSYKINTSDESENETRTNGTTKYSSGIPDFILSTSNINKAKFGKLLGEDIISTVNNAYDTIVTWKSNTFKLPGNATGKDVRTKMSRLCDAYTNKTDLEQIALKLLTIFCPLLLQKTNKNSKNKENIEHLKRRLSLWKQGEIDALVREGAAIQNRLTKTKQKPLHHAQVFTSLMLQGKVGAALRWISDNNRAQ